jgi:hypothetical protein
MNGTYLVGVNGERYADEGDYRMTFHPSAHSQLGAARIALEGKDLPNIDVILDRPRRKVNVNVRVFELPHPTDSRKPSSLGTRAR